MEPSVLIKLNALDNTKAAFTSLKSNIGGLEKTVNSAKKDIESLEPAFKKMALVGSVAFAGIVGISGKALAAYAEVERSQRQLEHAVVNVSKGTKEQVGQINELTASLEKKAGVDADSLNMGVAQLSTFGLSTDAVLGLTKSLADLTVNQSGVNATSDDYIQSANNIAKALNGQFGILEKSGIRFTEAQQNLILYGTETERVTAIQEGFAQNLRETTDTVAGVDLASAKMKRTMENISENLGKALVPAFADLAEKVQPVIEKFANWAEQNPELLGKIILIGGAIAGVIAVVGTLGLILPPIIAGFGLLAGVFGLITLPVLAVVAALAVVGAAVYLLWKNWDEVTGWIKGATEAVMSFVSDTFSGALGAVSSIVAKSWETIKAVFWTSINFIIGFWATLLDYLVPGWDGMLLSLWTSLSRVFGQISEFFAAALGAISGKFGEWFATFSEIWEGLWQSAKAIFETIWEAIKSVFDVVTEGIKASMESLVKPIQKVIDLAERAFALAGGVVKKAGSYVSSSVSSIIGRGSSITGKAIGGPVSANTPYIVGEVGEELFVPNTAGRIIPNNQLAGAGGPVIYQTFHIGQMIGDKQYALQLGDMIIREIKQNTRL